MGTEHEVDRSVFPVTHQIAETPVISIEPDTRLLSLKWREIWEFRELVYFLIWRDIKVRYKQTLLGAAWAIIQPFFTMLVFSLFFGRLAKIPSDGIPYPVFSFTSLVPWSFFATSLGQAANSLVGNASLITKVYFPKLTIPFSTVLSGLIDLLLSFGMLLLMLFYYRLIPTVNIIWLPVFMMLTILTSLGVGLWLSALNVEFRDVRYVIPFLTQFWMFSTPIAYSSSLLPEKWRILYAINPMVGVVEGFRWAMLGTETFSWLMFLISAASGILIFISGLIYFRRMEETFADVV